MVNAVLYYGLGFTATQLHDMRISNEMENDDEVWTELLDTSRAIRRFGIDTVCEEFGHNLERVSLEEQCFVQQPQPVKYIIALKLQRLYANYTGIMEVPVLSGPTDDYFRSFLSDFLAEKTEYIDCSRISVPPKHFFFIDAEK